MIDPLHIIGLSLSEIGSLNRFYAEIGILITWCLGKAFFGLLAMDTWVVVAYRTRHGRDEMERLEISLLHHINNRTYLLDCCVLLKPPPFFFQFRLSNDSCPVS